MSGAEGGRGGGLTSERLEGHLGRDRNVPKLERDAGFTNL